MATALVWGYVESRVGCKNKAESAACRTFLKKWHEIEADGNEMGVDLSIMNADHITALIFFNIEGVGPVTWLPVLITASNEKTTHITPRDQPNQCGHSVAERPCKPFDPEEHTSTATHPAQDADRPGPSKAMRDER